MGLITGGGQWVAGQVSNAMRQEFSQVIDVVNKGSKKRRRRGVVSAKKGLVFAQAPPGGVWPDLIVVNGQDIFRKVLRAWCTEATAGWYWTSVDQGFKELSVG